FYETGALELYDVVTDPGETDNLAGARPSVAGQLESLLDDWLKKTDAYIPKPLPPAIAP
ncbi:MAG: hypothetical protein HKN29_10460, partial [Rhodothermales bacterium]|nr:hypothetical protein [Rhodothermales bacterium]